MGSEVCFRAKHLPKDSGDLKIQREERQHRKYEYIIFLRLSTELVLSLLSWLMLNRLYCKGSHSDISEVALIMSHNVCWQQGRGRLTRRFVTQDKSDMFKGVGKDRW